MASLMELGDELLQSPADIDTSQLQEQIECDVRTLEEIMLKRLGPLPTPPLSPERSDESVATTSTTSGSVATDPSVYATGEELTESDVALLSDIQLLMALEDECGVTSDSQRSMDLEEKLISQDCMWGSLSYEPRCSTSTSDGIYTPAPSPPPLITRASDSTLESMEEESSSSEDNSQPECISPQDVFPALLPSLSHPVKTPSAATKQSSATAKTSLATIAAAAVNTTTTTRSKMTLRHPSVVKRWSVSGSRIQPHPNTTSESEEEIDVVTVPDRERPTFKMNTRKRTAVSLSAPVSRQTSPNPSSSSSSKRRRYHAKRLQRLNSSGGDNGADSDDEQRRASHNVLEKKRRNDLKYSFQVLRSQIPELEENQRAPKVVILRKATEFIRQMQEQDDRLEKELKHEILRKEKLLERLKQLKSISRAC